MCAVRSFVMVTSSRMRADASAHRALAAPSTEQISVERMLSALTISCVEDLCMDQICLWMMIPFPFASVSSTDRTSSSLASVFSISMGSWACATQVRWMSPSPWMTLRLSLVRSLKTRMVRPSERRTTLIDSTNGNECLVILTCCSADRF